MTPEWMRESVIKGLQGLLVLRLPGAPATDTVPALANAWIAILANLPRVWERERDQARLSKAFLNLATHCERWPTPAQFIEAIPPVPQPTMLNAPKSKNVPPEIRKFLDEFLNKGKAA